MPPFEDSLGKGELYFFDENSETYKPFASCEHIDIQSTDVHAFGVDLAPYEVSMSICMPYKQFELFIRKVSNNWLKMHGLPMRRKVSRKRKAKKNGDCL